MSGYVKPHSEQIHNAVRHTLYFEQQRLQQSARSASQKKPLERSIYVGLVVVGELLRITESFVSTSWNSAEEASETMQYFAEALAEDAMPAHISIPKGHRKPTIEEIRRIWSGLQHKLCFALREVGQITVLPYRRALEQHEWIGLFEHFEARFNQGNSIVLMDNTKYRFHQDIHDYADNVFDDVQEYITNSTETLYLLNYFTHEYGYELSGKWFVEMNETNGGYWIDKSFERWYCLDGTGFLAFGF